MVKGRPVLLSSKSIFDATAYTQANSATPGLPIRELSFGRKFLAPSVNLVSDRIFKKLLAHLLLSDQPQKILVVGGGAQRSWLDSALCAGEDREIVYTDIDIQATVDIFADAHELPFRPGSFDLVVTTAVLEHVMYPEKVAGEIHRVLKIGGWLYSELPFMQQVHEGAYDFTRYTHSGHRRLFNHFSEQESGMVAGPGTALVWAIENFFIAFFSRQSLRRMVKATVRCTLFWLKYFDYHFGGQPQAMDGASCTYFLGRKQREPISDRQIIDTYVGATQVTHT